MDDSFCYGFLTITIVLLSLLLTVCKIINGYWERKGVFTLKPKLFFGNVGNIILGKKCFGEDLKDLYDKLKLHGHRFGGYYFLMRPVFVVADLELVKKILITDFEYFSGHSVYINRKRDPLTYNLYSLKGEVWRNHRTHLSSAYTTKSCKMMIDIFSSCCKEMEVVVDNKVRSCEAIDIHTILCHVNIAMMVGSACGWKINGFEDTVRLGIYSHCTKTLHNQSKLQSMIFLMGFLFPEFCRSLNLRTYSKEMSNFFLKLVNDIIQYREENNIARKDLMDVLIQMKNDREAKTENFLENEGEENESITNQDIAAELFIFLLAGFETTSITVTFCIYEFCLNQFLQDKARDEIDVVLKDAGGLISFDSLSQMKYIDQCINETLRRYPPLHVHTRVCTKTYLIPGTNVTITKGTPLFVPVYGLHMDPHYFPAPENFDPDRFSEDNKFDAFLPFGAGPRTCIGYKFGLMQAKMCLVTLLRRYKLSLHPSTNVPIVFDPKGLLSYPTTPILIVAEKISDIQQ